MSRPMSGRTTYTSFGYKSSPDYNINPKVANYQTNGSGRDSYIKCSNGGFRRTWDNGYKNSTSRKKKYINSI